MGVGWRGVGLVVLVVVVITGYWRWGLRRWIYSVVKMVNCVLGRVKVGHDINERLASQAGWRVNTHHPSSIILS
jgi:uncharacterized membrane protein